MQTWPKVLRNLVYEHLTFYECFVWFPDEKFTTPEDALLDAVENRDPDFVREIRKSVDNIDPALQLAIDNKYAKSAAELLPWVKDPIIGMYAAILCNSSDEFQYHFEKKERQFWLNLNSKIYEMQDYAKSHNSEMYKFVRAIALDIGDEIDEMIVYGDDVLYESS